ncbi:hypothetical protein ACVWZ3_010173 [Bradyrhizobium sp. i1.3.6]
MTQIPLSPEAGAKHPRADRDRNDNTREIVSDVAYRQLAIVNVVFVGDENAGDGNCFLVDAGILGSAPAIRSAARARFGRVRQTGMRYHDARPFRSCRCA